MLPQNVFLPDILEGARMQDASAILADVPEGGSITAAQLTSASAMLALRLCLGEAPCLELPAPPNGTLLDSMSTLQPWHHAFTHLCPGSAEHLRLAACNSAVSTGRQQCNVQKSALLSAVLFATAVHKLHDELRHSVDLMGIGLDNPRQDNIAEEGTAVIKETNKDMGDVR